MNNLISKASVCEILADIYPTDGEKVVAVKEVDKAYEAIQQLPSAQPERKTGRWIKVDDPDNRISGRCSVCGWEALLYETDVVGMDYCPNCGARLEDEKE